MIKDEKIIGVFCALLAVLIWSGFILVSRVGGISALTPYDVIAIRYVTCAVLLFPIWLIFYRFNLFRFEFIISALIGGLAYSVFVFKGFELSSALHGGILLPGLIPVFVSIISMVLINAKLGRNKSIGLWMIIIAIIILFYSEIFKSQNMPIGDIYFVISAFFWALYSVLINIWHITPWQATCSLAFITCITYLPIYLISLPKNISQASIFDIGLQVFYQGFLACIVQMLLYVKAVKIIGAQGMGSFMALVPVLAGAFAVMFLDELSSWYLWGAMLLVSLGVLISNLPKEIKLNRT
ncbi:MAG: drug/metabolite transporter (DMT)-like permease [Bermanella sp.]|jgi:drug/metabolite transporter (DMT)-like permease